MIFYPNKETKNYLWFIILVGMLSFILWIIFNLIFLLFLGILSSLILFQWICVFFWGIQKLEIENDKVTIFWPKKSFSYAPANLYEIVIRKDGIRSYRFKKGSNAQQITPKAYLKWELLQKNFDRIYSSREREIRIIRK